MELEKAEALQALLGTLGAVEAQIEEGINDFLSSTLGNWKVPDGKFYETRARYHEVMRAPGCPHIYRVSPVNDDVYIHYHPKRHDGKRQQTHSVALLNSAVGPSAIAWHREACQLVETAAINERVSEIMKQVKVGWS